MDVISDGTDLAWEKVGQLSNATPTANVEKIRPRVIVFTPPQQQSG